MSDADVEVKTLIERITHQVLQELEKRSAGRTCAVVQGGACAECRLCVEKCPELVQKIVDAGAARIEAVPGIKNVRPGVAQYIDHTLLKPDATPEEISSLCDEARQYRCASVCVNPCYVRTCSDLLRGSGVAVCSVVGFPFGATLPEVKAYETERVTCDGASEVDMVILVGAMKAGDHALVQRDIQAVVHVAHRNRALVKVIIEAAYLTDDQKVKACLLARAADADMVKTSTGYGPGGATLHDVELMRRTVGAEMGVKAAGGVRDYETMTKMLAAGATRIGASATVKILQQAASGKQA
ncbi:MAG: Deoxyribose-phosphate aldolase 1 [Chloroflexi bacterium ADurb.Bin180]|nr:MAG: Deoxyribose-phosphate aldolase 1 [Chloroflexi bacterium ADurb.Bin180]